MRKNPLTLPICRQRRHKQFMNCRDLEKHCPKRTVRLRSQRNGLGFPCNEYRPIGTTRPGKGTFTQKAGITPSLSCPSSQATNCFVPSHKFPSPHALGFCCTQYLYGHISEQISDFMYPNDLHLQVGLPLLPDCLFRVWIIAHRPPVPHPFSSFRHSPEMRKSQWEYAP